MYFRATFGAVVLGVLAACGRVASSDSNSPNGGGGAFVGPADGGSYVVTGPPPTVLATVSGTSTTKPPANVFSSLAYSASENAIYAFEYLTEKSGTIWRVGSDGTTTAFLAGASMSVHSMAVKSSSSGTEVFWIDPAYDDGDVPMLLRSSLDGALPTTRLSNVTSDTIGISGDDVFAETTDGCIALVGSSPLTCLGGPTQAGSGFLVANGSLCAFRST